MIFKRAFGRLEKGNLFVFLFVNAIIMFVEIIESGKVCVMGLFSFKKSGKKNEQRVHKRHELFQATYYRMKDEHHKPIDCLIHNISMGGMLIEAKDCPEVGARVVIVVNLGGRLLHEKMEVVRSDKIITPRFGCQFIDETTREKREALLVDFLSEL